MEKYNGWTNYATWRVNLEFFSDIYDNLYGYDAKMLREYVEECLAEEASGMALSYALSFISGVNWYEIEQMIQDNIEQGA